MNIKLLLILFAAIGGISYGVLSNEIELSVQQFDFVALPAMDEDPLAGHDALGSFKCSCIGTDENGDEIFDPGFCNVDYDVDPTDNDPGIAAEGSLGLSGNKFCLWEAHEGDYGELISESEEGCSFKFWLEHSRQNSADYMWPPGYRPNYEYDSIFHYGLEEGLDESKIEKFKVQYEMYQSNLDEILEKNNIDKRTRSTLNWLLEAISSPDKEGYLRIDADKVEELNEHLLLLVAKEKLSNKDKKFLRDLRDDFKDDDYKRDKFTLHDALSKKNSLKNKEKEMARESVTAILNAAHYKVNYHYSVPEVMSITHDAMMSEDLKQYSKELKKYNNAGGSSLCSSNNILHDDSKKNNNSHDDSKKNDDSHDDSHDDSRDD